MGARCLPTIFLLIWLLCRETKGSSSDPCDNTFTGKVPNPNDPTCTSYINCWNYESKQLKTCGKRTWIGWENGGMVTKNNIQKKFKPVGSSGYCDWPWNVNDCNGASSTAPGPSQIDRCISGGSNEDWFCNGR